MKTEVKTLTANDGKVSVTVRPTTPHRETAAKDEKLLVPVLTILWLYSN